MVTELTSPFDQSRGSDRASDRGNLLWAYGGRIAA